MSITMVCNHCFREPEILGYLKLTWIKNGYLVSADLEGLPGVISAMMLLPWSSLFPRISKISK